MANSLTSANGSVVPKKFGWLTLVIPSLWNLPLSLAGLSWPVTMIGTSVTVAVLGIVSVGAAVVVDGDGDREGARRIRRRAPDVRAQVGVDVRTDHLVDARRAGGHDRADRVRAAVAPVDRGGEVGDRLERVRRSPGRCATGPVNSDALGDDRPSAAG